MNTHGKPSTRTRRHPTFLDLSKMEKELLKKQLDYEIITYIISLGVKGCEGGTGMEVKKERITSHN
jgi:hypothetical protein